MTQHDSAASPRTLYTIGHSNHTLEALIELLKSHLILAVADVRSSPYSRYADQFNKEIFESHLMVAGLSYQFLGHILGGRPQDGRFYDGEGYVLYDRIAATPEFRRSFAELLARAAQTPTVLLCGEEDPAECHRRLLLGRVAGEHRVEVVHLRGDGRVQSEKELADAERFARTKGQLSLFDTEGEKPWRSTRSVSREKRPGSS